MVGPASPADAAPRPPERPAAIVLLAGGRASRLPGKLFLEIDGEPLVGRIARRLHDPERAYVVATNAALEGDVRAAIAPHWPRALYVSDDAAYAGALAALAGVARRLGVSGERWFAAIAGDMPGADRTLVRDLERARDDASAACDAVVARAAGRMHPLATLYRTSAFVAAVDDALATGERRLGALLTRLACLPLDVAPAAVANLNTPQDLTARPRG